MIPSNLIILLSLIGVVVVVKFIHWTIVVHSVNMKLYKSLGEEAVKWILKDEDRHTPDTKTFEFNFITSDIRLAVVTMLTMFRNLPR